MVGISAHHRGRHGSHETAGGSYSERSSLETAVANHYSEEVVEVLAARAASKHFHFSRSLGICGVGTCSYLWWIWVLCFKPPPYPQVQKEFYEQVPSTVYLFPMVAFATATLLNIISWAFERRTTKKQLCFLAVYISSVACVYEFLAWAQLAPIYVTASGRPNSIFRYIMWGHATPAMLYAMGMMSDLSRRRVSYTIALDIVMIVTALPGELVPAWHRWIWNFISWAVSPYVFYQLWVMYGAPIRESTDEGSRKSLRALRNCTVVFWCCFPLVWLVVQLGLVGWRVEEILWSCADLCGKIVFSSTLLHGNFMTIEHRRYMAMRVVEEANRVRVIQELRDLLEQKEQFIALMSHELRTPLNGIIGLSSSLLTDTGGMDADAQKTVGTIHNSGCRLLNLINDILDAAALKKGKLVVQQGKVNLKNVTDDVLDLTQPLAKVGVSVNNRIPASLPPVVGDTARIVQILYNLIGNACKFTDKGDIWVDAAVAGDMVAVRVHDTGIGIPEEKLDDIFCPFQQVDMSTTRRYGGTGLGLSLVKQLVEAHGGTISVASKQGVGSTFTFMLRVWDEAARLAGSPQVSGQLPGSPAEESSFASRLAAGLRFRRSSADISSGGSSRRVSFSLDTVARRRHSISGPPPTIHEGRPVAAPAPWTGPMPPEPAAGESAAGAAGDAAAAAAPAPSRSRRQSLSGPSPPSPIAEGGLAGNGALGNGREEGSSGSGSDGEPPQVVGEDEMWQRLSVDCRSRTSYEAEANQYKKAPQQLDPVVAASVFAAASAPPPRPPPSAIERQQQQQQGGDGSTAAHQETQQQQAQQAAQQAAQQQHEHAGGAAAEGGAARPPQACGSWLAAEERVRQAERSGEIQVLSVDDDPVNQMVIQRMLSKAGFRVIKAATGDKALDLVADAVAANSPPDLVLLDVMMPGMSGYEVARCLRQQYPHLMLPIIMVSANRLEEHVVEGLQAGGNDYVTKPFGQKELIARIESQLRIKQFAESSAAAAAAAASALAPAAHCAAPGSDCEAAGANGDASGTTANGGAGLLVVCCSAADAAAGERGAGGASSLPPVPPGGKSDAAHCQCGTRECGNAAMPAAGGCAQCNGVAHPAGGSAGGSKAAAGMAGAGTA